MSPRLSHILEGIIEFGCIATGEFVITESQNRIVHAIAAVGGPISSLTHTGIAVLQIMIRKKWLTGTVDIGLEEIVGRKEVPLPQMMGTSKEEIRTIAHQALCIVLTIVEIHPTLLVRLCVDGVKTLRDSEDATVEGEEFQGVNGLMFVHLLVEIQVLFLYGLQPEVVDTGILLVGRISQKPGHQLFCLVVVLTAPQVILRLCHLSFLGLHKRER